MKRSVFWLLEHRPELGDSLADVHRTALEHAAVADTLGYDSLWVAEHHFVNLGTAANPAVVLAAIAQRTERLRLGPAVSVLPLRHPVQVAEDYALVDLLSGGRLNLGVGTGSQPGEFEAMGCDFDDRRSAFESALAEIRKRWAAAAAGERGANALNVAPVQSPAPPIYVATMSEEGAHAAGLQGDSMLTLASPALEHVEEIEARVKAHARGLQEGGHPAGSAEAVVAAFACTADTDARAETLGAPAIGRFIESMVGVMPPDPNALYGLMRERGTGFFGSQQHVAKQVDRFASMGVEHLAFVTRFGGMPAEAALANLRALAPEQA